MNSYSWLDRLVHRIAFSSRHLQIVAADIEDNIFGRDVLSVETGSPVFVTSLPRAGTTVLLTALNNAAPELATHLYRDMPFVMSPVLWSRLNGGFRKQSTLQERAHGDGIKIGYDSPEAFEEIIWRCFWPEKYNADGIAIWSSRDGKPEAAEFLARHFRKIVSLRCSGSPPSGRYLSKNNGNIARLDLLAHMYPDATILVPLRAPLAHAASLHRQHLRFAELHRRDSFAKRYMRDIGHYEFGDLHRPILFEGIEELTAGLDPADLEYWLAYWTAAFKHVAQRLGQIHLVTYEALCRQGASAGAQLCELAGLDHAQAREIGDYFRPAPPVPADIEAHRSPMRERAEALHARLVAQAALPA